EADRPTVPDAENSALQIIKVYRLIRVANLGASKNFEQIFEKLTPTTQLNSQQINVIRVDFAKILPGGLDEARKLKDMPRGRFPIKYSDDFISSLIPEHQNARGVGYLLQHDAYLLAQDRKDDAAMGSCRAILNTGRSMQDDLFLISLLIRIALHAMCCDTLERVLAQGTPSEDALHKMQTALEQESQVNQWLIAIRGERGGTHHLFENVRTGKASLGGLLGMSRGGGGGGRGFDEWFIDTFPILMVKDYPEHLHFMNRCVEIAKLPIHERHARLAEWEMDRKKTKSSVTKLLAPGLAKVHTAECRSQAMLRSVAAALACERYRLRHGEWPKSLDVLVQEKLLGAVPMDPMDNLPLRFRRTKDGIVIYSIGLDKADNQGNVDRSRAAAPGVDIGFRMWDPNKRRGAPLPPIAMPEVEQ
ncbi:MAG: hypothetical protein HYX68_00425, partial [Planctomycetes bacterium]|nr:hypothetical protein [Planctomycetota bacterium]